MIWENDSHSWNGSRKAEKKNWTFILPSWMVGFNHLNYFSFFLLLSLMSQAFMRYSFMAHECREGWRELDNCKNSFVNFTEFSINIHKYYIGVHIAHHKLSPISISLSCITILKHSLLSMRATQLCCSHTQQRMFENGNAWEWYGNGA